MTTAQRANWPTGQRSNGPTSLRALGFGVLGRHAAGGQQGQNGDTTPLSEGSRKRESLPARPVQRATHPGRLQPRPPQSAGPAPPAMRARRDAARSSPARYVAPTVA